MSLHRSILYGGMLVLFAQLSGQHWAQASKILFLGPIGSRSHNQFFRTLVTTLAKHGHEMTFVSAYPPKEEFPKVRDIILPDLSLEPFIPNFFEEGTFAVVKMTNIFAELCADGLQDPQVVQLFNETFDMIMTPTTWAECFLVFQHHLKVPLVLVTATTLLPPEDTWFGNPSFPSYDLNYYIDSGPPLSLRTRLINTLTNIKFYAQRHYRTLGLVERVSRSRDLLPEDMPPLENFLRNANLLILNNYRVLETPRGIVQNIIHAGGLHIRPTKPLPQDLEEWVQGAGEHGFIYFSLGTFLKTTDVPKKYLSVFLMTFRRLPQRVLMKWNEDHIEGLPPNVRLGKWLPQQDILAHPKLRLFICHGGLHGTQEALNYGVPILGMPIFSDQKNNIGRGARQGWALRLDWSDLTEEALMSTIDIAVNDTRVRDQVQRMSAIIRDQPMTPEETVVYWVEYVLRHGGARHLRCPAAGMNWFILYNLDAWIIIVASVCVAVCALFVMGRCLLRKCWVSKAKKKTE